MLVADPEEDKKSEWKKPHTMQMPILIKPVLEEIRTSLGRNDKQKWAIVTAAVLRLLDAPQEVQRYYVSEAIASDWGEEGIAELIKRARNGELQREAEEKAKLRQAIKAGEISPEEMTLPELPNGGGAKANEGKPPKRKRRSG